MKSIWYYDFPIGKIWITEEKQAITHIDFSNANHWGSDYKLTETALLKEAGRQLSEYFAGERQTFTLPLSLNGTKFQQSVWHALQEIPFGETRSYKEIAFRIGNPKAPRAVGMANNRNPIAIIVPCHRVIGHDGSLVGYGSGLAIKEYLLNLEKPKLRTGYFVYGEKETTFLKKRDPILGQAIDRIGPIKRQIIPNIFKALVNSIIGQQISAKAHTSVWNKMQEQINPLTPETIQGLSAQEIQAIGISGRKSLYIKNIADNILKGSINLSELEVMPDEKLCEHLTKLKGVGIWTAEMLMIFSMQRPNILSWGDSAIQKGLRMLYGHQVITPELFQQYKKLYSPYSSIASLYLWEIAGGACPELIDPASQK